MTSLFASDAFNARLFFPRSDTAPTPDGADDAFVDVDDARLHVRIHRRLAHERATVVLFHGNGEVVCDYDDAAARFATLGARLAVVDYRGYGLSSGTPSFPSMVSDADVVLDALLERAESPLVVMGRSLGSACVHHLAPNMGEHVAAFIIESGFSSLTGLVERRQLTQEPSRLERAQYDPATLLAQGTRPLLVMHGSDDDLIDVAEARAAFSASASAHKSLAIFEGFGHNDIAGAPDYFPAIGRFLDDALA